MQQFRKKRGNISGAAVVVQHHAVVAPLHSSNVGACASIFGESRGEDREHVRKGCESPYHCHHVSFACLCCCQIDIARLVRADEGLRPIKTIAAPEHPTREVSLADGDDSPDEAAATAPRVKPQLPRHLWGAFSPNRAKPGSVPVADSLPVPELQTDKDLLHSEEADADAVQIIQVGLLTPTSLKAHW